MTDRRKAREIALQALYAWKVSDNPIEEVIGDTIRSGTKKKVVRSYAETLFRGVVAHEEEFNAAIAGRSKNWDLNRIAKIDSIIMHIALCEYLYSEDVPPKVAITEALEIAKRFSTERSSLFINGMLDALFREWHEEGKVTASAQSL